MLIVPNYVWKMVMTNKQHTNNLNYTVIRSRRKSIALIVKGNSNVEIRCPQNVSLRRIEEIIDRRSVWIRRQQQKQANRIDLPDLNLLSKQELKIYKSKLEDRIANFMRNYDGPLPAGFTIRRQKARWGSCSNLKNININLKALFLPDDIFEYLLEHELAHLIHMNHSSLFWQYLEDRLPDARKRQRKLKDYRLVSKENP